MEAYYVKNTSLSILYDLFNNYLMLIRVPAMSDKSELKAELERKKQRLAQIREEKKRKEEERKKKEVRTCIFINKKIINCLLMSCNLCCT